MEMKKPANAQLVFAITFLFLVLLSAPASAQLLYDNGSGALGTLGVGDYADANNDLGSAYTMAGDVFTAASSGTANSITFAGLYYNASQAPTVDSFTVSLYSVTGDEPDTLLTSSAVSVESSTIAGYGRSRNVYQITGILDVPLTLTFGTQYYLGISDVSGNGSNPTDDFAVGHTAASYGSNNGYSYNASTQTFTASGSALAYTLDVPEPSDATLLVLGGAGLFAVSRYRSRFQSR